MSAQTRVVLATLCVFNATFLAALGVGAAVFVDGPVERLAAAVVLWAGAALLLVAARRLRRPVEWR